MVLMSDVAHLVNRQLKPVETDDHEVEYAPNGDPVLSPSQAAKFIMCPRKWAAQYIHGQKEPVGKAAADGKRMHTLLEVYYKKGIVPGNTTPEGVWAQALIRHTDLPLPKIGAKRPADGPIAERRFKFEHDGVWWRGSKDLTYMIGERYIIRDHKSTSELNPLWVKTEEQLKTDPQSVIYAYEACLTDDPDEVENEWGYVTREKSPKTDLHRVHMTWDITHRGMEEMTRIGREMLKHYRERPALNALPALGTSNGGCEAFRGCKVVGCNVTALDRIKGQQLFNARKQGGSSMSYFEDMKARQAQQQALTGGAAASAPAPTPVDIRTWLAASVGAGAAVAPEPYTPPPAAVTPAPAPSAAAQAPAPGDVQRRPRGRARAATTPAPSAAQVIDTVGQAVGQAAAKSVPPPNPGPSSAMGVLPIAAAALAPCYVADITGAMDGYKLFINCAPMGEPILMFSQYCQPIFDALKEAHGWNHYGIAQFEGKAAFQDALTQYLEQSPPIGNLIVSSSTDEGRDALPTLERYAVGKPVRGF